MRPALRYPLLICLAICLGACSLRTQAPATDTLQELYRLVNAVRSQGYDCGAAGRFGPAPPLRYDERLARAAHRHSADMATHGFISHTGSDNSSVAERVAREGYRWSWVGENLAWSSGFDMTPQQVLSGWLTSPGHCGNILNRNFTEVGLGKVDTYWTQVFATPREP